MALGNIIISSPYTPYSIYLRGNLHPYLGRELSQGVSSLMSRVWLYQEFVVITFVEGPAQSKGDFAMCVGVL